jgi:hypothetical protein
MGQLRHMTCFESQCQNRTSFFNFTRLDLFFQNEASVSPWFLSRQLWSLFGMKKKRKNNEKMTLPLHLIFQPEHTDRNLRSFPHPDIAMEERQAAMIHIHGFLRCMTSPFFSTATIFFLDFKKYIQNPKVSVYSEFSKQVQSCDYKVGV